MKRERDLIVKRVEDIFSPMTAAEKLAVYKAIVAALMERGILDEELLKDMVERCRKV